MKATLLPAAVAFGLCLGGSAVPCLAQQEPAATDAPLRGVVRGESAPVQAAPATEQAKVRKYKKDMFIAYRMAKDPWIDRACMAEPSLVAAICAHPGPARLLAKHRHIGEIAEADHYLCRRLTRWRGATKALVRNKFADKVIARDPEGIYRAIDRDPLIARMLTRHLMFNQMVVENPDLGKVIARHM
ncbi:MAG TPA: hypothetical protein V6D08_02390 [Candidatus Obscuribacterales bacterium]